MVRRASAVVMLGAVALLAAAPHAVTATVDCPRQPSPGRVVCAIEVEAPGDGTLAWSDAIVTAAPPFARPLRARGGPGRPVGAGGRRQRFEVALAATDVGTGTLTLRARAVVCRRDGCRPAMVDASARVRVGAVTE